MHFDFLFFIDFEILATLAILICVQNMLRIANFRLDAIIFGVAQFIGVVRPFSPRVLR